MIDATGGLEAEANMDLPVGNDDDVYDEGALLDIIASTSLSSGAMGIQRRRREDDSLTPMQTPTHTRTKAFTARGMTPGWAVIQASPASATTYLSRPDAGKVVTELKPMPGSASTPAVTPGAAAAALDGGFAVRSLARDDLGSEIPLEAAAGFLGKLDASLISPGAGSSAGGIAGITSKFAIKTVSAMSSSAAAAAAAAAQPVAAPVKKVLGEGFTYPIFDLSARDEALDASVEARVRGILASPAVAAYATAKTEEDPEAAALASASAAGPVAAALTFSDLCDVGTRSARPFYIAGRVRDEEAERETDSALALQPSNVIIEGLRELPGRTKLILGHALLKRVSLFPGQVVVARGVNHCGRRFIAEAIFTEAVLPTQDQQRRARTRALKAPAAAASAPAVATTTVGGVRIKAEPIEENKSAAGAAMTDSDATPTVDGDAAAAAAPACPGGLSVVVCCGPFTTSDNLHNAPLFDLLSEVLGRNGHSDKHPDPDVLVLCGPFVDGDGHPLLSPGADGGITVTYEAYYEEFIKHVQERVVAAGATTKVVVVPSLKDSHHFSLALPQAPFAYVRRLSLFVCLVPCQNSFTFSQWSSYACSSLFLFFVFFFRFNVDKSRIFNVTNPAVLDLAGVTIGVTSHDVIFELGRAELYKGSAPPLPMLVKDEAVGAGPRAEAGAGSVKPEPGSLPPTLDTAADAFMATADAAAAVAAAAAGPHPKEKRLVRLTSALLEQGTFYPLYPAPAGTSVDPQAASTGAGLTLPFAPDILITPSRLRHFAERVPLPGHGSSAGYGDHRADSEHAVVCVNPETLAKGQSGGTYARITVLPGTGPVPARTTVQIVKI
jgi:hypothetical protein